MATEQDLIVSLNEIFGTHFIDHMVSEEKVYDCGTENLFSKVSNPKPFCLIKPSSDYNRQLSMLINLARTHNKKVIVRGGGSGVCGAFKIRGGEIIVDMTFLDKIVFVKKPTIESEGLVMVEAGVIGNVLDDFLKQRGCTHGHYPASLSVSTVGGWLSTKSNGHYSLCFGNVENLVVAVEGINGKGMLIRLQGEDLKKVFRMEGTTMIVTRVWLKIFKIPAHEGFSSFQFNCIGDMTCFLKKMPGARDTLKKLGVRLYAVRAYDLIDYKFVSKPNKDDSHKSWLLEKISYFVEKQLCRAGRTINNVVVTLEKWGLAPWTTVVYMAADSKEALAQATGILKDESQVHNGTDLGQTIARSWYSNRFKLRYKKIVERFRAGITVDTFECPVTWEQLIGTYEKMRALIFKFGMASAHIGIDMDTPYLYFIFGIPSKNLQKYREARDEILQACVKIGIATTHHHGIGKWKAGPAKTLIPHAYGPDWYYNTAIPAKREMDPWNILNPHNLFTDSNKTPSLL